MLLTLSIQNQNLETQYRIGNREQFSMSSHCLDIHVQYTRIKWGEPWWFSSSWASPRAWSPPGWCPGWRGGRRPASCPPPASPDQPLPTPPRGRSIPSRPRQSPLPLPQTARAWPPKRPRPYRQFLEQWRPRPRSLGWPGCCCLQACCLQSWGWDAGCATWSCLKIFVLFEFYPVLNCRYGINIGTFLAKCKEYRTRLKWRYRLSCISYKTRLK